MYKEKRFRMRSFEEVYSDLLECRAYYSRVKRIFFADGDALAMHTGKLLKLLNAVHEIFPECERVSVYGRATALLKKSGDELLALKEAGLGIVYIGAESGSPEVLSFVNKGETAEDIIEAVQRAESLGIKCSVTFISGLGGVERTREHAEKTAEMINKMGASFVGLLTLMLAPGTPMFDDVQEGRFMPLGERGVLEELELILKNTNCFSPTVLRSNHVSNRLVLRGTLPQDKEAMLNQVKQAMLQDMPDEIEYRGL